MVKPPRKPYVGHPIVRPAARREILAMDKAMFQLAVFENGKEIQSWEFEHSFGTFASGDRLKLPGRDQPLIIKEVVHEIEQNQADATMNRLALTHRTTLFV